MDMEGATMITTPFGPIKIYADDVVLDYEAITHLHYSI